MRGRQVGLVIGLAALAVGCSQAPTGSTETRDVSTLAMHTMPLGTAEFTTGANGDGLLHLDVGGLQPDSRHPVGGACDNPTKGGALGVLAADATGHGALDLHVRDANAQGPLLPYPQAFSLMVGPGDQDPAEAASLACVDVPMTGAARFRPAPAFGQAHVKVDMSYARGTRVLSVHVSATGLAPNSRHPNHIHTGQCESEGPVREVLRTLLADRQGRADVTTTIPESDGIKPGAWYVAVHSGPALDNQVQYAVLACGDVSRAGTATP